MTKRKPRPVLPQIQNIKWAVVANFAFDAAPGDLRPAEAVLAWLNGRTDQPRSAEDIGRHLDGLRARVGGECAMKRAAERSLDLRRLRAPPNWVKEFGFCTFPLDGIVVSVDVFNAADELKLGDQARNVVELFRIDGGDVTPLVNAANELMDSTDTTLVFGGISFASRCSLEFARSRRRGLAARSPGCIRLPLAAHGTAEGMPGGLSRRPAGASGPAASPGGS